MNQINEEYIKDKLTKICPCKQITRLKVKEAIEEGAITIDAIKSKTGATTGCCGGRRCRSSIEALLQESIVTNN